MSMETMVYLAEVVAAVDALGTLQTLRYSDMGYSTRPGDTPANAHYAARIDQPGLVRRDMFANGKTGGANQVGYGVLTLINADGALDPLLTYGFAGRPLTILLGPAGGAYSDFQVVLAATTDQVDADDKTVTLRVKDKAIALAQPLASVNYAGTNALPAGVEGTPADVGGSPKPRCYGQVFNVAPVQCNTSKQVFQVHNGAVHSIDAVYDRGVALTAGSAYASQADMLATAPTAGQFRAWPDGGMFRLNAALVGECTADVSAGANAAARTVAQVLKAIALDAGVDAGDIAGADVTALDTANSAVVGLYVADTAAANACMDLVASSIGAWYGFNSLGVLRMGRLVAPAGTPVATLTTANIIGSLQRVTSNDDTKGAPAWRVRLGWGHNYTQQTDLAGSVTDARKAWLALQQRTSTQEDASVLVQYLNAPEYPADTLLTTQADADAEAARQLALRKVRRDTYTATVRLDAPILAALDIGTVVNVIYPRYGFTAGRLCVVLGLQPDLQAGSANLTLWG